MAGKEVILFTLGLPGHFAQWCDTVVSRLAGAAGQGVVFRSWPSLDEMFGYQSVPPALDELGRILIAQGGSHVVVGLRQPDHMLRRVFAERKTRFVIALDDPREAAADLLAETGADPKSIVRAIASSCALVMQYTGLPGVLAVHAQDARTDPAAAVSAIAGHLGIAVEPGGIAAIVDEMAALGSSAPSAGKAAAPRVPVAMRQILDGAVLAYRECFLTGRLGEIVWKRDLFTFGDGKDPTEPIDVAGGVRILSFGPYIHLPAGTWTAQVILGFSREAAGHTFLVDAYADGQLASTSFQPEGEEIRNADLTFSLGEPSGGGVEVRVMVTSEKARGQLAFGHVVLRPVSMRRPDAISGSGDFASVLGL